MIFKSSLFLSLIFFNLLTCAADVPALPEVPAKSFFNQAVVGFQVINFRYTEPGLISDSGFLFGIFGETRFAISKSITGIINADLASGTLDYNGSLCSVASGACTDYSAKTQDVILHITQRFDFEISEKVSLFIGPGFRVLIDKGVGNGFYTRFGTYLYAPLGITFQLPRGEEKYFLDLEYDLFLRGTMKSKLSETNSRFSDVNHTQTNGSGLRISLKQQTKIYERSVLFSLFYENWFVGDSDVQPLVVDGVPSGNFFIEPKNFTNVVGLGLELNF